MREELRFSIVVPVYNRPDEIADLLQSLLYQGTSSFEVIVVEDGSTRPCLDVVRQYEEQLSIHYRVVPNGGPSKARNIGSAIAVGTYLLILDSDVVLPPDYLGAIERALTKAEANGKCIDAFGGPDAASDDFTPIQKAINYSMTSFLTTGGIRGGKKRVSHYFPRSFNLGCRRSLYAEMGGFDTSMRYGEDVDFSMRLHERGAHVVLLREAFVYHKRRVDFRKFFRQVHQFGGARIALTSRHPGSLRLIHLLPSIATVGLLVFFIGGFFCLWSWLPIFLLALLFFVDALRITHSLRIALLAIVASFIQVCGYGSGLIRAALRANK